MSVDFRAARRQIELVDQCPALVRRAAFAIYVGLFDLADDAGRLEVPSEEIGRSLHVTRAAWDRYRDVLVAAGLLRVGPRRGGYPTVMQLLPPVN
jgi:hypothetical protein